VNQILFYIMLKESRKSLSEYVKDKSHLNKKINYILNSKKWASVVDHEFSLAADKVEKEMKYSDAEVKKVKPPIELNSSDPIANFSFELLMISEVFRESIKKLVDNFDEPTLYDLMSYLLIIYQKIRPAGPQKEELLHDLFKAFNLQRHYDPFIKNFKMHQGWNYINNLVNTNHEKISAFFDNLSDKHPEIKKNIYRLKKKAVVNNAKLPDSGTDTSHSSKGISSIVYDSLYVTFNVTLLGNASVKLPKEFVEELIIGSIVSKAKLGNLILEYLSKNGNSNLSKMGSYVIGKWIVDYRNNINPTSLNNI